MVERHGPDAGIGRTVEVFPADRSRRPATVGVEVAEVDHPVEGVEAADDGGDLLAAIDPAEGLRYE